MSISYSFRAQSTHLSARVGNADIAARVALFGQLAGEEVVELGAEDTVSHELSLLGNLGGHFGLESWKMGLSDVLDDDESVLPLAWLVRRCGRSRTPSVTTRPSTVQSIGDRRNGTIMWLQKAATCYFLIPSRPRLHRVSHSLVSPPSVHDSLQVRLPPIMFLEDERCCSTIGTS